MSATGNVLLIEDEKAIALALRARLDASGYHTETASDAMTGLALADQQPPDAILLDVRLPDLDGFETCRRLKANRRLCHVPVIFLSASVQDEARRLAGELGAAAYLSKPYQAAELLATLSEAMRPGSPGGRETAA
ncbi:MAG: response regulator [Phycisphaeraceae bacterium]|nr:response regulator [Phycisphaeraceae bacterium]